MKNLYIAYLKSVGFTGVAVAQSAQCELHPEELRAFSYEGFSPEQVKNAIGRPKAHVEGLLCWRMSRTEALRVETERKLIVLGNGKRAVNALLQSVENRKE